VHLASRPAALQAVEADLRSYSSNTPLDFGAEGKGETRGISRDKVRARAHA